MKSVNEKHLPATPQSSPCKSGEDEGTSAGSEGGIGLEVTSSVMMMDKRRTTVRTVEGVIIDVEMNRGD